MNPNVARLVEEIPPPADVRPKDWRQVESRLGTALPADYKQLVDLYGGGVFDDTIWLLEPDCANEHYDLLTKNKNRPEELEYLWATGEPKPAELHEEGSKLVAWAVTENGEYLFWLARSGQHPDDWTIMINEGRGPEWESHPVSCSEFLRSILLTGGVESDIFFDMPFEEHDFRASADFL
ncbi:hypothetical protein GCM10010420_52640 [Streptomyces glaucosporus]|uniref:Knr4/Smi1-like domain-containing protein n=1 Tax=Streptomyces glaucosporus TaxID=284044 RepID=A0ABP5VZN9_9ACTN